MIDTRSIVDRADELNRAAEFLPQTTEDERPAVRIAGILVFAYIDSAGALRVTVGTETADEIPEWEDGVPMRIRVNDGTVFEGTDEA
jgi:hypothetical protein